MQLLLYYSDSLSIMRCITVINFILSTANNPIQYKSSVNVSDLTSLTGTTGLQVHGRRLSAVEQWQRTGSGVRVCAIRKRFVVQVVERAVRLTRLVTRTIEYRPADEFVFDGARTQTTSL